MQRTIDGAFLIVSILVVFMYLAYLWQHDRDTTRALEETQAELAETQTEAKNKISELEDQIAEEQATSTALTIQLTQVKNDYLELLERLLAYEENNTALQEQIVDITSELSVLDKLTKTDRELLQKYSKVYFLNENYVPSALATITPEYLLDKDKPVEIHRSVATYLARMLQHASSTGYPVVVVSAYRTFGEQATLKSSYRTTYGIGANKFSAEQGYSEHQLGTTVDLTTEALGDLNVTFEGTGAYQWLQANAHLYGFILSYTKGNTYYQFEPWHWRFVGVALATKLHDEKKTFYDMDQREINTYLVSIFD